MTPALVRKMVTPKNIPIGLKLLFSLLLPLSKTIEVIAKAIPIIEKALKGSDQKK
jgi:hypothetical protein